MRESHSEHDRVVPMPDADTFPDGIVLPPTGPWQKLVFRVGSVGLLAAAAIDGVAVLGRHAGFSFLGSIELVQVAVVLIASAAVIGATLVGSHASVHIVTERLSPTAAARAHRAAATLSASTFVLFATGSVWVASDLWSGHERTELLNIPLGPFRLIWIAAALVTAALFARQALARGRS